MGQKPEHFGEHRRPEPEKNARGKQDDPQEAAKTRFALPGIIIQAKGCSEALGVDIMDPRIVQGNALSPGAVGARTCQFENEGIYKAHQNQDIK